MCLSDSCIRHSLVTGTRVTYLSNMQNKRYQEIHAPAYNIRTPAKKFFSFLLAGALASIGVLLFPSLVRRELYFPYIDLEWLRPAAGILATVAVASIILDGPLQQAISRQHPNPRSNPASAETDGHHDSFSVTESAFDFAEKQLKAGDYVIMGTGFLASMCASLAIFEIVDESGLDSGPNYSLLPLVIFTVLAHAVIVGVCSIGLGYDNERFLHQRYTWRTRKYHSQWSELWQITEPVSHAGRCPSRKQTLFTALAYVLFTFAFMLLPLGFSVEHASETQGFRWFSPHDDISAPVMILASTVFSISLVLGSWVRTNQIIEREVSLKKFHATGSSSFAGLIENTYTSIVINFMSTMVYIILTGFLFVLFGFISALAAGALVIIQFFWLRSVRHSIIELDFSDEGIWHENIVSSTFNIGQRLQQEALTSFHRADKYLQKQSYSHSTGI